MRTLNILIVDDELGMRLGASRALRGFEVNLKEFSERINFKCDLAESGAEAFEKLENNHYDMLLLDYKLQDITGLDILEKNQKDERDILTIMITAFASLEVAITATKRGAFDFLAKPFTPEELKVSVEKGARHLYLKQKAQKLEKEKKQVRFQFISVLAHELKSPLAAVEGYLYIMKERIKGNDISNYDEMMERSMLRIEGMRKMVMDILDLTKIESGQKKRELKTTSINQVADFCLENIDNIAKDKGITVTTSIDKDIEMIADRGEIEIVLNNLLTNAVKYNKNNGRVHLDIKKDGHQLKIVCEDSGIGMSPEELSRLFKEFVRIKNSKTRNILGSGLGLSILKKIADLYQGDIKVTSEEDQGTKFTITLSEEE